MRRCAVGLDDEPDMDRIYTYSQRLKEIWDEEAKVHLPVFGGWSRQVGDPPRDSNFKQPRFRLPLCCMCGEELDIADLTPYHTPHFLTQLGGAKSTKDCTPSCMWCAETFSSKQELEEHEGECGG
jgi:hypothetical protein